MSGRAVRRAVGVPVFIVVLMTIVLLPAIFGLYVDGQSRRMGPESAPTMVFVAIGVAAVATGLSQIDTKRLRPSGPRQAPPLAPTLVQVLLIGPLLGIGIALATILWRALSVPDGEGSGLWNDYLASPLAMLVLALAVWSTTNIALAIGSILGGTTHLAVSCAAAGALLISLFAAPAGFLWLQRAEPDVLLLALGALSVPVTLVATAGAAWLRSSGALLRSPASASGSGTASRRGSRG